MNFRPGKHSFPTRRSAWRPWWLPGWRLSLLGAVGALGIGLSFTFRSLGRRLVVQDEEPAFPDLIFSCRAGLEAESISEGEAGTGAEIAVENEAEGEGSGGFSGKEKQSSSVPAHLPSEKARPHAHPHAYGRGSTLFSRHSECIWLVSHPDPQFTRSLHQGGLERTRFFQVYSARNTLEEAEYLRDWLSRNRALLSQGPLSIAVLAPPLRLRRVREAMDTLVQTGGLDIRYLAAEPVPEGLMYWWRKPPLFEAVVREWGKVMLQRVYLSRPHLRKKMQKKV